VIEEQAERLDLLVADVLDASMLSQGRLRIREEDFCLAMLSRKAVAAYLASIPDPHSPVEVEGMERLPVRGDRTRIEQVVVNLMSNAMKYGQGKPITVALYTRDGLACLAVIDHGMGIPEKDQGRVFGRFVRVVSKGSVGGLGLGLYICKKIADAHGGDLSVQSTPGQGACFELALPMTGVQEIPKVS
jgi:signal transduction histidine kinase